MHVLSCSLANLSSLRGCQLADHEHGTRREHRQLARRRRGLSYELGLLWRDYFRDPSQWWDIRKTKSSSSSPDFKHKKTKHPLWLNGCHNPCWVQEELQKLGLLLFETHEAGEFDVENASIKKSSGFLFARPQSEDADDFEEEEEASFTVDKLRSSLDISNEAISLLKDCANRKNLFKGFAIHSDLVSRNLLETNAFLCNTLLNMYAECGALEEAQDVFDESMYQNVVLWSTLIGGYAKHGHGEKALTCFEQMQSVGVSPNAITFIGLLKACGSLDTSDDGQRIHAQILRTSLLDNNVLVATALMDMYAKCGLLYQSQKLFNDIPLRNEVSWTALIAGYTQHDFYGKALECYEQMQAEGFCPNAVTFTCILKTCGCLGLLNKGRCIHAQIARECSLVVNTLVASALVTMYAKCNEIVTAQELFDMLEVRNVSLWNALITGYIQHGQDEEALRCFKQMQLEGILPDAVTYICILQACGNLKAGGIGQDVYAQVVRESFMKRSMAIACAAVDMHARCGAFQKAWAVFAEAVAQNVVLWNALINGYAEYGHHEEAIECFEQIHVFGLSPDEVTFTCILKTCGSSGALSKGQTLHTESVSLGFLDNMFIGTALIDMYSNCGMLMEARAVLDALQVLDVVAWSALMVGFAQYGRDDIVFTLFQQMDRGGTRPNAVTFSAVLSACSHRGLFDKGQLYFELMIRSYGVFPNLEHLNTMLDLFGRAGLLEQARAVIEAMPFLANVTLWHTFLGACSQWGHAKFGRQAFKHAVQMDGEHPLPFVYVGNIPVGSGWHYDVHLLQQ